MCVASRPAGPGQQLVVDVAGVHGHYQGLSFTGPSYQAPNIATAVAAAEAALGRGLGVGRSQAALADIDVGPKPGFRRFMRRVQIAGGKAHRRASI